MYAGLLHTKARGKVRDVGITPNGICDVTGRVSGLAMHEEFPHKPKRMRSKTYHLLRGAAATPCSANRGPGLIGQMVKRRLHDGHTLLHHHIDLFSGVVRKKIRDPYNSSSIVRINQDLCRSVIVIQRPSNR